MKIVRLGMTESSLFFLTYISRKFILDPITKQQISKIILSLVNWLYTTSGYYDKSVIGNNFNFNVTALNKNYFKFINHLEQSVNNCEETHFFIHEGFVMNLLNKYKTNFINDYNIKNFTLLNGTKFPDRIESIFNRMKNKKILVISSFDGLIKQQYDSGNVYKIYKNFPQLQSFEVIKFPYCFFNNGPHNNYFETLDVVFDEIKKIDFDFALLGCGSYGHMLCHKIDTELNKDAIYIGGSIQTLFGILSKREKDCSDLPISQYWVTEIPDEYKPPNYKLIENGCYW